MDIQSQSNWTGEQANDPYDLVVAARCIIAARQVLNAKMPNGFTGDPAMQILLDLFAERGAGGVRTMTMLGRATGLQATTLSRWCKALAQEGLVRLDAQVALTERGMALVADIVGAVAASRARVHGTTVFI